MRDARGEQVYVANAIIRISTSRGDIFRESKMTIQVTLDDVLHLAEQLPRIERGRLIARLAVQLADESQDVRASKPFPVISEGTWTSLPTRREDLYDD